MRGSPHRLRWLAVAVGAMALAATTTAPSTAVEPARAAAHSGPLAVRTAGRLSANATPQCTPLAGQPAAGSVPGSGLPPLPCLVAAGNSGADSYRMNGFPATTRSQAVKPKIDFAIPPVNIAAYQVVCIYTIALKFPPTCPYDIGFPPLQPSVGNGFDGVGATAWVQSPAGVEPEYGVFPSFQVGMLAFGAIPVTATVHITQPLVDGVASPLTLRWWTTIGHLLPGQTVPGYEQYGPAPDFSPNLTFFAPPASITGTVVVQLTDVTVDRQPIDVGPACQTRATMDLSEVPGYYAQNTPTIPPVEHKPGEWLPLSNITSYVTAGHIDLPAFTGCHNGGDNLDPLITAMVSGPNNPVQITQKLGLQGWCTVANPVPTWCTKPPATAPKSTPLTTHATTFTPAQQAVLNELPATVRAMVLAEAGHPQR